MKRAITADDKCIKMAAILIGNLDKSKKLIKTHV